jgi:hypothetical protein
MSNPIDLFGPATAQKSMFGAGANQMEPPRQRTNPDPETIRLRLRSLLETARLARLMPWSERDARMWQIVFPQMANWLPEQEAEQLCFEFAQEIRRLQKAA